MQPSLQSSNSLRQAANVTLHQTHLAGIESSRASTIIYCYLFVPSFVALTRPLYLAVQGSRQNLPKRTGYVWQAWYYLQTAQKHPGPRSLRLTASYTPWLKSNACREEIAQVRNMDQQQLPGIAGPAGRRLHIAHRRSPSEMTPLLSRSCQRPFPVNALDESIRSPNTPCEHVADLL